VSVFNDHPSTGKDFDANVLYDATPGDHRGDVTGMVRWPMPLRRRTMEEIERDFAERVEAVKKHQEGKDAA